MAKTVFITGGARGIGADISRLFAKKGYNVFIGYNTSFLEAQNLKEELLAQNLSVEIMQVDVSNSLSATDFIQKGVSVFGKIDVLINNAGIAEQKLFTDITDDDWNKMLATNLSGVFFTSRAASKHFINKKSGCIINISSMWGEVGASMEVHYSAAKAGVIGFTKALAKELGPSNIRVNAITPGVIDTKMNEKLDAETLKALAEDTPLCRIGEAKEIAKAAYFLAEDGTFITGQILGVNGGMVI